MGFYDFSCPICGMNFGRLEEMRKKEIRFPSPGGRTYYKIYKIDDEKLVFLRGTGKPSFPVSFSNF